jgi:hypothetical protein
MNRFSILKKSFLVLFISSLLTILVSCNKDTTSLGMNALPSDDTIGVSFFDTTLSRATAYVPGHDIAFDLYGQYLENINNGNLNYLCLGELVDPVFGKISTEIFAQTVYVNGDTALTGYTCDSVIMTFNFRGLSLIGKKDEARFSKFKPLVYKLKNGLTSKLYYTDTDPDKYVYHNNLSLTNNIEFADSFFSIDLKPAFGDSLIQDNLDKSASLKGLYIKLAHLKGPGAIATFDMASSVNNLVVYAHKDTTVASIPDTLFKVLYFSFDNVGINNYGYTEAMFAIFNTFTYNYSQSVEAKEYLDNPTSDSLLFIQNKGGVKTSIIMPSLYNLTTKSRIIINKAEFSIPFDSVMQSKTYLLKPNYLYLRVGFASNETFDDYNSLFPSYIASYYNSTTKSYVFNVTALAQYMVNNKTESIPIAIYTERYPYITQVLPSGLILKNSDNIDLKVTYSTY